MTDVTRMLSAIEQGDPHAAEQLLPLVYDELRRLAAQRLAQEKAGQTLDATALVHEAYLRLAADADQGFANRRHFFATAAQAMRRILVENARAKGRAKWGGGRRREHPDLDALDAAAPAEDLLALHDALERFAAHDTQKASLVELRFFGGLSIEETADILNVSPGTVMRDWTLAKAWLRRAVTS